MYSHRTGFPAPVQPATPIGEPLPTKTKWSMVDAGAGE